MKAIICLANGKGNYIKGMARLAESLRNNFDGDFLGYTHESQIDAPLHLENPYAFKVYAFERAFSLGYTEVLWLDASCFAIKNVQPIFDVIRDEGYIMQEAGHYVGNWCNDETLKYFNISRELANKMLMYGNAGFLGLNRTDITASAFFHQWGHAMTDGMFKGSWDNHRHDMTCGSIVANRLGMKYKKGDEWLQYAGLYDETANDTIIFKAQGL